MEPTRMDLNALGFDAWFERHLETIDSGLRPARVTAVDRERYLIRDEHGERPAELTGRLLFAAESAEDMPTVGDWVSVQDVDDQTFAIIHDILPRRTVLRRKTAGKSVDVQLLAANIDTAFIIQSVDFNFNLRRLERYLVMIRDGGIEPAVLLSKIDLDPDTLEEKIGSIRDIDPTLAILPFSSLSGRGIDAIRAAVEPGKTYCLLGSSGVGKTTLLNRLVGKDAFSIAEVRDADGKGRHTTTRRQLVLIPTGGMIIDTPGMRELGAIDMAGGIAETFSEFEEYVGQCRYADCTHTHEAGCAVISAIESGDLDQGRYESYLKLMRESAHHARTYLERRQRDKSFGKMVKTVKKFKKQNR